MLLSFIIFHLDMHRQIKFLKNPYLCKNVIGFEEKTKIWRKMLSMSYELVFLHELINFSNLKKCHFVLLFFIKKCIDK